METLEPKLTIELVPITTWEKNLRRFLTKREWELLSEMTRERAGWKCEVCGAKPAKNKLHAHEQWGFDWDEKIQWLFRLVCLCNKCHAVKHIGREHAMGREKTAILHLQEVNGWSTEQAKKYVSESFKLFSKRSKVEWSVVIPEELLGKYREGQSYSL